MARFLVGPMTLALLLAAGGATARQAPLPSASQVEKLGRNLQQRQRERLDEQSQAALVPWQQISAAPDMAWTRHGAAVHLPSQMNSLRAIWLFEPVGGEAKSLRVLLGERTEQWIVLAPGRWRVRLITGPPDAGKALHLPPQTVEADQGHAYELALTQPIEQELQALLRTARKKPAREAKTPIRSGTK